jgi:hypothetical protein
MVKKNVWQNVLNGQQYGCQKKKRDFFFWDKLQCIVFKTILESVLFKVQINPVGFIAYNDGHWNRKKEKKSDKLLDLIKGVEIAQDNRQSIKNRTMGLSIFSSGCPIVWSSG